mgnify:CR=1 FL=1
METGGNSPNLIQANNFNIALSQQYHLSIEVGLNNFSFCILDTKILCYTYLENHIFSVNSIEKSASKLRSIINNNHILKANFYSISVAYKGFPNTLVPLSLFNKDNEKDFLDFNTTPFDKIYSDEIKLQEAKLVYSVPENINSIIDSFFPKANFHAQESNLINQYSQLQNFDTKAYINISDSRILITIFKNGRLLFNNSFSFSTKEDILYYTLFSFEQLKLSTENIEVELFGRINKEDEKYKILYDYIRNISFGKDITGVLFANEFKNIDKHQYYALFSQVLCA